MPEDFAHHSPQHGAELRFLGVVRGLEDGRLISGIRYSAYEAMALEKLGAIAAESASLFPGTLVRVQHRTGFVAAGEASLLISAASKHSAESFELCQWLLRRIKTEVPIWKEPVFTPTA